MKRQKLSAIVAIRVAIAIVIIMLLVPFDSDEYAKYLPMAVWLLGSAGFILHLSDKEE